MLRRAHFGRLLSFVSVGVLGACAVTVSEDSRPGHDGHGQTSTGGAGATGGDATTSTSTDDAGGAAGGSSTNEGGAGGSTGGGGPAACNDGIQDGDEEDVDCGGSCGACVGASCNGDADCRSNACDQGVCVTPFVRSVAVGSGTTCVLTDRGGVKCWGVYSGNGAATIASRPVDVDHLTSGVSAIAADHQSCAVTSEAGLVCWGQLDLGNELRTVPTSIRGLSTGVSSVAVGETHACALLTDGKVECWESNAYGELGDGTTHTRWTPVEVQGLGVPVRAIAAGSYHTCALTADSGLKCWGKDNNGALGDGQTPDHEGPVDVLGLTSGVVSFSAGAESSCAVTSTGVVKCWGSGVIYQVNAVVPTEIPGLDGDAVAVACGTQQNCILTSRGGVKCWGIGPLGDGTRDDHWTPIDVVGLESGVVQISVGAPPQSFGGTICGVLETGHVRCWGKGPVGDGTMEDRLTPVEVSGL